MVAGMRVGGAIWLPLVLSIALWGHLVVVVFEGTESGSPAVSLLLAFGFSVLTAWQIAQRRQRHKPTDMLPAHSPAPPSMVPLPVAASHLLPPDVRVERRRYPRLAVDWAAEIVWHHAGHETTRIRDLSRGGARLMEGRQQKTGRRGLLLVPGLHLPVPFTVVGSGPVSGLHIRFDLEGMGLDELEQQMQVLAAAAEGTARMPSVVRPAGRSD